MSDILLGPCLKSAARTHVSVAIQMSSYWDWTTFVMLVRRRFMRIWEFQLKVSGAGEPANAAAFEGVLSEDWPDSRQAFFRTIGS